MEVYRQLVQKRFTATRSTSPTTPTFRLRALRASAVSQQVQRVNGIDVGSHGVLLRRSKLQPNLHQFKAGRRGNMEKPR